MGGGSGSSSSSSSTSNSETTKKLGNTTTNNPYLKSKTTNKGTTTAFAPGTALSTVYDFSNQNIGKLLEELVNPTINTEQNQARMRSFQRNLADESRAALENNIIAPLAQRNMIRSSQATDMYNNLANQQTKAIANYTDDLISNGTNDTANIINNIMNLALQGYNAVSGNQAQSLSTSLGNASQNTKSSSQTSGHTSGYSYGL